MTTRLACIGREGLIESLPEAYRESIRVLQERFASHHTPSSVGFPLAPPSGWRLEGGRWLRENGSKGPAERWERLGGSCALCGRRDLPPHGLLQICMACAAYLRWINPAHAALRARQREDRARQRRLKKALDGRKRGR